MTDKTGREILLEEKDNINTREEEFQELAKEYRKKNKFISLKNFFK